MRKAKRIAAALFAVTALAVTVAPAGNAAPDCRPGKNANPQPGFKPGSC